MSQDISEVALKPSAADCYQFRPPRDPVPQVLMLLVAASVAACSEPAINSGDQVVVRILNSTGLTDLVVRVRDDNSTSIVTFEPDGANPGQVSTSVEAAGEPVHFHVEAGDETTDHTCHVHPDAVGNPDNIPMAVIYSEPLRVVCQSGWLEEEAQVSS